MTIVGMMHHYKDPCRLQKSYAFVAVAKAEGVEFFYFSPGRVNLEEEIIYAYVYENGDWHARDVPFPDVVYNAGIATSAKMQEIIHQLSSRIPFTSHSVGDKLSVYQRVAKAEEFAHYLLPTQPLNRPGELFSFLKEWPRVVIKPRWGHKGIGVFMVEGDKAGFHLVAGNGEQRLSRQAFTSFMEQTLWAEQHIMQPYLPCRTRDGLPYDLRLHVQKNGQGTWTVPAIYPRVGPIGGITTNISSGGATSELEPFLRSRFADEYYNVMRYLDRFALSFARHMDNIYGLSFDELGIDVGLDESGKIWLYEVNWRPGSPPVFYQELDVVKNTLLYACYLAAQQKTS